MLSVMMAWETIQNAREDPRIIPDHIAMTLSFVILRIYQTREVTVSAPQKAAGIRAAKSVNPKTV